MEEIFSDTIFYTNKKKINVWKAKTGLNKKLKKIIQNNYNLIDLKALISNLKIAHLIFDQKYEYFFRAIKYCIMTRLKDFSRKSKFKTIVQNNFLFTFFRTITEFVLERYIFFFFRDQNNILVEKIHSVLWLFQIPKKLDYRNFVLNNFFLKNNYYEVSVGLNIYYNFNIKNTDNIYSILYVFRKFHLISRDYFRNSKFKINFDFLKIFLEEKSFSYLNKFFFFIISDLLIVLRKRHLNNRLLVFVFFEIFLSNYSTHKGNFSHSIFQNCKKNKFFFENIDLIRRNNIPPCIIRIYRIILQHVSDGFRDFFLIVKKKSASIFFKLIRKLLIEDDFLIFINQKILRSLDEIKIFNKNINTKLKTKPNFINKNIELNIIYYKNICLDFQKQSNLNKTHRNVYSFIKISNFLTQQHILTQKNTKIFLFEIQIFSSFFSKFSLNIGSIYQSQLITFPFSNKRFFKVNFMNNLPNLIGNDFLYNRVGKYICIYIRLLILKKRKNKKPKKWLDFLLNLILNVHIDDGLNLLHFFFSFFNHLSNLKIFFSKVLDDISAKTNLNCSFSVKCSITFLYYIYYFYPDFSSIFFPIIYIKISNLDFSGVYILLIFLEICFIFLKSQESKNNRNINKFIGTHFLLILISRILLNQSKRDKKLTYIYIEKFLHFVADNSIDPNLCLARLIRKYKNNIEQIDQLKENFENSLINFLYLNQYAKLYPELKHLFMEIISDDIIINKGSYFPNSKNFHYFEKLAVLLSESSSRISRKFHILIITILSKSITLNNAVTENYFLLILYICFSSIDKELKTIAILISSEMARFNPFSFHQQLINLDEFLIDENYKIVRKMMIFLRFILCNNYLKINYNLSEKIIYKHYVNIGVELYSFKLINFIHKRKKSHSGFSKSNFLSSIISKKYLSEIELKISAFFYFKSILLPIYHNKFFESLFQITDKFKLKIIFRKLGHFYSDFSFSEINIYKMTKQLFSLDNQIYDGKIFNILVKFLLKLKYCYKNSRILRNLLEKHIFKNRKK
nr:fkbp-like protein [Cryptomonas sp.]